MSGASNGSAPLLRFPARLRLRQRVMVRRCVAQKHCNSRYAFVSHVTQRGDADIRGTLARWTLTSSIWASGS